MPKKKKVRKTQSTYDDLVKSFIDKTKHCKTEVVFAFIQYNPSILEKIDADENLQFELLKYCVTHWKPNIIAQIKQQISINAINRVLADRKQSKVAPKIKKQQIQFLEKMLSEREGVNIFGLVQTPVPDDKIPELDYSFESCNNNNNKNNKKRKRVYYEVDKKEKNYEILCELNKLIKKRNYNGIDQLMQGEKTKEVYQNAVKEASCEFQVRILERCVMQNLVSQSKLFLVLVSFAAIEKILDQTCNPNTGETKKKWEGKESIIQLFREALSKKMKSSCALPKAQVEEIHDVAKLVEQETSSSKTEESATEDAGVNELLASKQILPETFASDAWQSEELVGPGEFYGSLYNQQKSKNISLLILDEDPQNPNDKKYDA